MAYQASPHHRHQASLEGVLDFSTEPPLTESVRTSARRIFYSIVHHFSNQPQDVINRGYNRPLLAQYTHDYAQSDHSRDLLLRFFFQHFSLPIDGETDINFAGDEEEERLRSLLMQFSDHLLDNFFLPLRASSRKTPQPTPTTASARLMFHDSSGQYSATPSRLSALRGTCLLRDRHRCVISRAFDNNEAKKRFAENPNGPTDDDGLPLVPPVVYLEVAHIMPHSLMTPSIQNQAESSKQTALHILNMFDVGVSHLISGSNIDRPSNALTLSHDYHGRFGEFEVFFTPVPDQPHTYKIETFLDPRMLLNELPVVRTLYLSETRTIDPPSPRLLAIHRAIAHILHLSGAGEYIDKLLRDWEDQVVRADGSTNLASLVTLGLQGWLRA